MEQAMIHSKKVVLVALAAGLFGCEATDGFEREPGIRVQQHKQFTCVTDAVQQLTDIKAVEGTANDSLAVAPTKEACRFDLVYRTPGRSAKISGDKPGGYLMAVGGQAGNGQRIVCASNIDHKRASKLNGNRAEHQIRGVSIECASYDGSRWSPMRKIVDGGSKWAGWVLSVRPSSTGSRYLMRYTRDFSFQFMNVGDVGRPETDGIYDVFLEIGPNGPEVVREQRYSNLTSPPETIGSQPWEPTIDDINRHPGLAPDNGRCPAPGGCPVIK